MASKTLDPIDILLELGIDLDDLSEQDYLSALMEAIATIEFQTKGKGDERSAALREEVHTQLLHLASQLHLVQDNDTLKGIRSYITSAWNLIKVSQHPGNPFLITKYEPSNKRITPMRPFFSTKKKRKQSTVQITKPTAQQKDDICTALLDKHTSLYCSDYTSTPLSRITISKCTLTGTSLNVL